MDQYLKTKLLPPRLGGRVLGRPRLLERMRRMVDLPATIVCANAGCGKTTLVNEFVRACGLPFVWQQIDGSDIDLAVFFSYLVYGIKRLRPEFGELVLGYIRESEELGSKAEQLADIFINEVAEDIEEKMIIVLDDYHHVDKANAIAAALDRVLQYLPDVLHIVITTRNMPNLSISRLKSKGMVGIIDRQDLLFTEQEVAQLFRETFARPLPDDLVSQFHSKTEGWVTALQLIQQSLDRVRPEQSAQSAPRDSGAQAEEAPSGSELAVILQQSEVDIFDYFAAEVLHAEDTATRLMLGRASLLERIEPAILAAVFGDAQ